MYGLVAANTYHMRAVVSISSGLPSSVTGLSEPRVNRCCCALLQCITDGCFATFYTLTDVVIHFVNTLGDKTLMAYLGNQGKSCICLQSCGRH
jgi:hypothetical protein